MYLSTLMYWGLFCKNKSFSWFNIYFYLLDISNSNLPLSNLINF